MTESARKGRNLLFLLLGFLAFCTIAFNTIANLRVLPLGAAITGGITSSLIIIIASGMIFLRTSKTKRMARMLVAVLSVMNAISGIMTFASNLTALFPIIPYGTPAINAWANAANIANSLASVLVAIFLLTSKSILEFTAFEGGFRQKDIEVF